MPEPALKVTVRIDPPDLSRAHLDVLMDGEISAFEKDLRARNAAMGLGGEPLTSIERGTLKAYLFYAVTRKP